MQCKLVAELPEGPEWQYEIKYDGYRALAVKRGSRARILSRRGNDLGQRFSSVAKALTALPEGTMLDGEVVALGPDGRPRFKLLHRTNTPPSRIFYYLFDILAYQGKDVRGLPLRKRQALLEPLLTNLGDPIRHSPPLVASAEQLIAAAKEYGFEGVIAKRIDSVYEPGQRSGRWVKRRVSPGQELVIGGYLPGSHGFDSLLVGYYDGNVSCSSLRFATDLCRGPKKRSTNECVRSKPQHAHSPICRAEERPAWHCPDGRSDETMPLGET